MNGDQVGGIVRAFLSSVMPLLITAGILPANVADAVVTVVVFVVVAVWSYFTNKPGTVIPLKSGTLK